MAFCFLGLKDYLYKTPQQLDSLFKHYGNPPVPYEELVMISKDIRAVVDGIAGFVSEDKIHFESPVHWNYSYGAKPTKSSPWGETYLIKDKTIGRYTRKLPAGQKASEEAKALARRVFMELGEDKTIVDEFVRKVRVKVTNSNHFN